MVNYLYWKKIIGSKFSFERLCSASEFAKRASGIVECLEIILDILCFFLILGLGQRANYT